MGHMFFFEPHYTQVMFKGCHGVDVQEEFLLCAEGQLRKYFEAKTGLKAGKQVSTATPLRVINYVKGEVSSIDYFIYIAHNWNPVKICWQSKSGRIYDLEDTNIQCDDIIFWFEGLDPIIYYKQLYPNDKLPFKLKDLEFELIVERLLVDATFTIYLKGSNEQEKTNILSVIDNVVYKWNEKAERSRLENYLGVIHKWRVESDFDGCLVIQFDTGSADILFYKKLLIHLNKLGSISKIVIG